MLGAVGFTLPQLWLFSVNPSPPPAPDSGWFLNSGAGILTVCGALMVIGAIRTVSSRRPEVATIARGLALGAFAAMSLTLAVVGPGNIFPLVLLFGGALLLAAAFTGSRAGQAIRRGARRGRGST